jgi:hypothetical protein
MQVLDHSHGAGGREGGLSPFFRNLPELRFSQTHYYETLQRSVTSGCRRLDLGYARHRFNSAWIGGLRGASKSTAAVSALR